MPDQAGQLVDQPDRGLDLVGLQGLGQPAQGRGHRGERPLVGADQGLHPPDQAFGAVEDAVRAPGGPARRR